MGPLEQYYPEPVEGLNPEQCRKDIVSMKQNTLYRNLIFPVILYLSLFLLYPFFYAIFIAFRTQQGMGLENFKELFNSTLFTVSLRNNIIIPLISISIELSLGILLAVAVNKIKRHTWIIISLVMLPFILPEIVFLTAQRFIFAEHGYVNSLLSFFEVNPIFWLEPESFLSILLVSLIDAWRLTPLVFLIVYAALKNIPRQIEEQAEIDGANRRQLFFYIILPLLTPAIFASLVLRSVDGLRIFATPLVLAGVEGVPVLSSLAYHLWSDYNHISLSCAASFVLAILILASSFLYVRIWKKSQEIQI